MLRPMFSGFTMAGARLRVLMERMLARLGFRGDSYLLILAVIVGIITSAAAVGFHLLIVGIRNGLYDRLNPHLDLYGNGIWLLVLLPAGGGLAVGLVNRYAFRTREGHGILDVMESVIRSSGIIRPITAMEKILTSGITMGTGGSAGAEGPIVQIGAGIASGIGQLFRVARPHMPLLIGCGSAAGISAIFNSPIGGVFFTLEVILLDFSIRTFTPVVLASVIANVTTKGIFLIIHPDRPYEAIFAMAPWEIIGHRELSWGHMVNFVVLGALCGAVGLALTKTMHRTEVWFRKVPLPQPLRPALGGAMLGATGVLYVMVFGWWLLDRPKPIAFEDYPLPAFFSDGYGVISQLIRGPGAETTAGDVPGLYSELPSGQLLLLLGTLAALKVAATGMTLSSGGSGGIIAPSLFLGAAAGGFLGLLLRVMGMDVQPHVYALVGMGAVLAAVVHAPLASILIVFDLTHDHKVILPAMLATIVATGTARLIFRDSIYTMGLRARGIRVGTMADLTLLRRLTVEQTELEPAMVVREDDPLQKALELADQTETGNFVVCDERGDYVGMLVADDIKTALLQREAVPLLVVGELMRGEVPMVGVSDDLASVLDAFALHDVDHLPVSVSKTSGKVCGVISRAALMRRYQKGLAEG